jgi:hypothetical protein
MADGKGCKCAAYSESECGCDADWTPQEVYDLRAENERLKEAIRRLAEQDATLSVCDGNVAVTMDGKLTDAEWDEIEGMIGDYQVIAEFNEERCHPNHAAKARRRAAMLFGLLERLG